MTIAHRVHRRLQIEELEPRHAPAPLVLAIGGTTTASFTDADGDEVFLRLTGGTGRVEISDATGNAPSNSDIAYIKFTVAGPTTTLVAEITGGTGSGRTPAGDVVAKNGANQTLPLNAFIFPGDLKSLTAKQIRLLTLDGDITGTVVLDSFSSGRINAVNINNITVKASIMGSIVASGNLTGVIQSTGAFMAPISIGGDMLASSGLVSGAYIRMVSVGGSIQPNARITAVGEMGSLTVGGDLDGTVDVAGTRGIRLVSVGGNVGGAVAARGGDINIFTASGDMEGSASITSKRTLRNLSIGGSVLSGARVTAEDSITAIAILGPHGFAGDMEAGKSIGRMMINGEFSGAVTAGTSIMGLNRIGGDLSGGISAGSGITGVVDVAGSMTGTIITMHGSINAVTIRGATLDGVINAPNGNIFSVSIPSGEIGDAASIEAARIIGNVSAPSTAGNMRSSSGIHAGVGIGRIVLGGDLEGGVIADGVGGIGYLQVGGNVLSTAQISTSLGSLASLNVGGDLESDVTALRMGSVSIAGHLTGSISILSDYAGTMNIGGDLASSSPLGLAISITGSLTASGKILVGGTGSTGVGVGTIQINGAMNGLMQMGVTAGAGVFGDVIVLNSLESTGQLIADANNNAATMTATTPNTMTYTIDGGSSGKNWSILFGNTTTP